MKNSSHLIPTARRVQGRAERGDVRSRVEQQLRSDRCEIDVVHIDAVRKALAALPTPESVDHVAELLGLLANPTRLTMLLALQPGRGGSSAELCVCDLATVTGASKSLTSHQLRLLRAAGLVRQRRAGKLSFYRLSEGPAVSLLRDLARIAPDSAWRPLAGATERDGDGPPERRRQRRVRPA
jgi:DNA-binding transcriptional ArsR family regulator